MPPLEKTVVKRIIETLNALPGCRAKKHHGSQFGSAEVDVYGCIGGRAFFLEAKRPGGKASLRQEKLLREWGEAGAITAVVTSAEEAVAVLRTGGAV